MLASPGTKAYNALAIFLQSAYQQAGYHPVPGQCFYPAPAVASALLKMEKKTAPYLFAKETRSLIRRIFTQRRKQIGSLLKKEEQEIQQIMTSWLKENNICSTTRPEKISVDQWIKLGKQFPYKLIKKEKTKRQLPRHSTSCIFFSASAGARIIPSHFWGIPHNWGSRLRCRRLIDLRCR